MKISGGALIVLLSNLLIPISLYTFSTNLLQHQPLLADSVDGKTQYVDFRNMTGPSPFTKVVFMVVDALRRFVAPNSLPFLSLLIITNDASDYVYASGSEFTFTQSLIRSGAAMPFTVRTNAPSLTRSCIKSMAIGSVPPLEDSINNLQESSEVSEADTWLGRIKMENRGDVVLVGDGTWTHLFPHVFDRTNTTSTYFDPSHEAVDSFVISTVRDEVRRDDWSALVVHFSGLDMASHLWGAEGPNFRAKQRTADNIIQDIYSAIEQKEHPESTLLVLTGDHGTSDTGDHGGFNEDETSPALVFMSSQLQSINEGYESPTKPKTGSFGYYTTIQQIDIAPTLAGLLGFPIPVDSQGVFIGEFLPLWRVPGQRIWLLLQNIMQLIRKHAYSLSIPLHDRSPSDLQNTKLAELDALRQQMQGWLADGLPRETELPMLPVQEYTREIIQTATADYLPLRWLVAGITTCAGAVVLALLAQLERPYLKSPGDIFFSLLVVIHALFMFSRSGVEGEYRFWYFSSPLWFTYFLLTGIRSSGIRKAHLGAVPVVLQLLTQYWSKSRQNPFLKGNFIDKPFILWTLVALTYTLSSIELYKSLIRRRSYTASEAVYVKAFAVTVPLATFLYKLGSKVQGHPEQFTSLPTWITSGLLWFSEPIVVQCAYWAVLFGLLYLIVPMLSRSNKIMSGFRASPVPGILELLGIYLMTQSDARNIPMFLNFRLQLNLLREYRTHPLVSYITH